MTDAEWMQICKLIAVLAELPEADRRTWRDEVLDKYPQEKKLLRSHGSNR